MKTERLCAMKSRKVVSWILPPVRFESRTHICLAGKNNRNWKYIIVTIISLSEYTNQWTGSVKSLIYLSSSIHSRWGYTRLACCRKYGKISSIWPKKKRNAIYQKTLACTQLLVKLNVICSCLFFYFFKYKNCTSVKLMPLISGRRN